MYDQLEVKLRLTANTTSCLDLFRFNTMDSVGVGGQWWWVMVMVLLGLGVDSDIFDSGRLRVALDGAGAKEFEPAGRGGPRAGDGEDF